MARRYKDKNFFSFFLLLSLTFVGLVIANYLMGQRTTSNVKASAPRCMIRLPDKYQVGKWPRAQMKRNDGVLFEDWNKYYAVERGKDIVFEATCVGFSSKPVNFWNFGEDCERWERARNYRGSSLQRISQSRHKFNKNGDYWVGVWIKEGSKSYYGKIKVGVYDKAAWNVEALKNREAGSGEIDRYELNLSSLVGGDARLAGFSEKKCIFTGSNLEEGDVVYRELVPASDSVTFDDLSFSLSGDWPDFENTMCHVQGLSFWEDPNRGVGEARGEVTKMVYILKGSGGENGKVNLQVEDLVGIYRGKADYVETPACLPAGQ